MSMFAAKLSLFALIFCVLTCLAWSTTADGNTTTTKQATTAPITATKRAISCEERRSCSECTDDIKCYWCSVNDTCKIYPKSKVIPRDCSGNKWFWKQCAVPGYVLIIVVPTVCGLILLFCGCCIYCCCCRGRSSGQYSREDSKFRHKKEEIRQRYAARRAERKIKTDAIRKKYGLLKDSDDDDGHGDGVVA